MFIYDSIRKRLFAAIKSLANISDELFCKDNIMILERITIGAAVIAFIAHIVVIFLQFQGVIPLIDGREPNYLQALATPFSFILIWEMFQLLVAMRDQLAVTLVKQFQVVALILIRNVFKDISELTGVGDLVLFNSDTLIILVHLVTGLLVYVGAAFYYKLLKDNIKLYAPQRQIIRDLEKASAVFLVFYFIFYSLFYLTNLDTPIETALIQFTGIDLNLLFIQIFVVLILSDTLLLLFYFIFNHSYQIIFQSMLYVIAAILVRLGITGESITDSVMILSGVALGLITEVVAKYFQDDFKEIYEISGL